MNKNVTLGLVLVVAGALLIVQKMLNIEIEIWSFIWPLFLLVPGITMHTNFFAKRTGSNNLVVAGILTTYGLFFLVNAATGWRYSDTLSFIYPLGIGFGFFESYMFGSKSSGHMSATVVFFVIAVIMFFKNVYPEAANFRDYVIPIALIAFGILVLFRNYNGFGRQR